MNRRHVARTLGCALTIAAAFLAGHAAGHNNPKLTAVECRDRVKGDDHYAECKANFTYHRVPVSVYGTGERDLP